jgi:hypothetical protein
VLDEQQCIGHVVVVGHITEFKNNKAVNTVVNFDIKGRE